MSPTLKPGDLVVGVSWFKRIYPGEIVIFNHDQREKIKRVEQADYKKLFVIGDNLAFSSDSRSFGWIDKDSVIAKIIWPKVNR